MPLTYSVAYGLIAGIFSYATLNGLIYITKIVSGGRIQPPDADAREYWSYKFGGGNPPWFVRLAKGQLWRGGGGEEVECKSVASLAVSEKELVDGVNGNGGTVSRGVSGISTGTGLEGEELRKFDSRGRVGEV